MARIAGICAEKGVRTYLTVNTVIYDNDMETMRMIISRARQAGISAIIASDMAAIMYAREIGQEVHISTQVNVSNTEAVRFYSQFADVMVLARELNMEQVAEIHHAIEKENICTERRENQTRNVLPRSAVHGGERKMLHEPSRNEFKREPRGVQPDMPPSIHGTG